MTFFRFTRVNFPGVTKSFDGIREKSPSKKAWSVHGENLSAIKRSANKYSVFKLHDENEISELNEMKNREIVKEIINQKRVLTDGDMLFWNIDMVAYYKQRKEQEGCMGKSGKVDKGGMNDEEIDVFNDDSGMAECLNMNEMIGIDKGILVQSMLFELRSVNSSRRMLCAIIYAANGGMERRTLWKDLVIYKRIMGTEAWFLMGDMNVTLFPNEHSTGCSNMTSYMCDFKDYVNSIEVEDIASTGQRRGY
ncbi:hypothetical protein Tco_1189102 [Tanacetum coccineum]